MPVNSSQIELCAAGMLTRLFLLSDFVPVFPMAMAAAGSYPTESCMWDLDDSSSTLCTGPGHTQKHESRNHQSCAKEKYNANKVNILGK
jgi:hypothetical protein